MMTAAIGLESMSGCTEDSKSVEVVVVLDAVGSSSVGVIVVL